MAERGGLPTLLSPLHSCAGYSVRSLLDLPSLTSLSAPHMMCYKLTLPNTLADEILHLELLIVWGHRVSSVGP